MRAISILSLIAVASCSGRAPEAPSFSSSLDGEGCNLQQMVKDIQFGAPVGSAQSMVRVDQCNKKGMYFDRGEEIDDSGFRFQCGGDVDPRCVDTYTRSERPCHYKTPFAFAQGDRNTPALSTSVQEKFTTKITSPELSSFSLDQCMEGLDDDGVTPIYRLDFVKIDDSSSNDINLLRRYTLRIFREPVVSVNP